LSDQARSLEASAGEDFCYLTTRGRISGKPHEIEIWFVVRAGVAYLMAGGHRSDWVLNLGAHPDVILRIGDTTWSARAGLHDDQEDLEIRRAMAAKYQGWFAGRPLSGWAQEALIVAVELV
jgi:deazaflavin-dependent oxidoreductase (nitroreductase family)